MDDVLSIVFDQSGTSVLEYECPPCEAPIDTTVFLEAKSEGIEGWSYGVRHDPGLLSLESVTIDETTAGSVFGTGFNQTTMSHVMDCTEDPDPACPKGVPGGGYISAIVLSFGPVFLPLGQSSLCRARYKAQGVLAGTQIELSSRLRQTNARFAEINFTVDGRSKQPRTVVDGWVMGSGRPFHRGDANADGRMDVTDALHVLFFLYLLGPAPPCLESADFDDNGRLNTADAIGILRWVFLLGSAPPSPGPPFRPCDRDPLDSPSNLGCSAYESC